MTNATTHETFEARKLVAFRLGEEDYSVDIMVVREIRSSTRTTQLPNSPSYVRGVINLRGAVVPVVDLAARLGMQGTDGSRNNVIIVIEEGGRLIGLLVDAVSDILAVASEQFLPTPDIPSEELRQFIACVATVEERMIQLVATDQILEPRVEHAA
ncbi:MAG: chemotaxis protein CheW [Pseudomonadota bacterium]